MSNKAKQLKSTKKTSSNGKVFWRPRWVEVDLDGNRKIKFGKSQETRTLADQFSEKAVSDLNNRNSLQLVAEEEAMTVGEFAETHWLKAERQRKVKNKAQIRTVIKYWKEIGLWDIKIEDLTSAMMYKYIKNLADRGLKPASIQNYKTELRTLLDLARTLGQTDKNVLLGVKNERRTQEQEERSERIFNDMMQNTWTLEEIQTNLMKLRNIPRQIVKVKTKKYSYEQERSSTGNVPEILWYGRFLIGFYLGLRSGEILALKFSDFDFQNKEVVISKAIARRTIEDQSGEITGWVQEESRVKRSSQRIQNCPDVVIDFVKELAIVQDMLGIYHSEQYLFVNDKGHLLNIGYFRKNFVRIQELVGIERPLLSPKYTRHTSATVLAGLGWSSIDIANHLGHKNDRVTREYYIKQDQNRKQKMIESLTKGFKEEE